MRVSISTLVLWLLFTTGISATAWADAGLEGSVSPRRLLEVVDIDGPTLSPDGRHVAFRIEQASVERNTYDTIWYVQGLEDPWPRRVADGGIPLRDSAGRSLPPKLTWSPDGRSVYYLALIDGRIDVWRAAADGSGATPVTLDAADVRDFALAVNGLVLRYSVGATREEVLLAEQAEYDRGVHIDETVPIGQGLFRSGNLEGRLATQRFGKVWFDRAPLLADVSDQWLELDLASGTRQPVGASEVPSEAPSVDVGSVDGDSWKSVRDPLGSRVALLTRVGERSGQLHRPHVLLSMLPDRQAPRAVSCAAEACTDKAITRIQWRPNRDEVVFVVTDPDEGLAQSVHTWNVKTGKVRQVLQSRGLVSGGRDPSSDCGISAEALVCVAADADRPPRLEKIDLDTGRRHVLFDPNEALALDIARVAPTRLLRWQDEQGRSFTGQFYSTRWNGASPAPLFVTYYSCAGFLRGGVGDEWPLASLAQAGISALCINYLPGYTMDAVERHGQGLAAVNSAIDLLASKGEIDRARVGMGGLSFGGAVTLWTASESDLLAAASVANPVATPYYYLLGSMRGDVFLDVLQEMWGLGSPDETPERWEAISPVFKLDRIRTPILFQHSEQEYMYALEYVIPLLREDRADLYVFPHEPHQKFQPRHKHSVYERNVDWFRFWLQDYEDAEPRKQVQYARWRKIRMALEMDER